MAKSRRTTTTSRNKSKNTGRSSIPTISLPKISVEAVGILLLLLAAALLVSVLFPAPLTEGLNNSLHMLFGFCAYLVPILIGGLGLGLIWPRVAPEYKLRSSEVFGWLLVLIFILNAGHYLGQLFDEHNQTMGVVGQEMAIALHAGLGSAGSFVILIAVGVAGAMLSTSTGIAELFSALVKAQQTISSAISERFSPGFKVNRPVAHSQTSVLRIPTLPRPDRPSQAKKRFSPPVAKPAQKAETAKPTRSTSPQAWQLPPTSIMQLPTGGIELGQAEIRQKVKLIEDTLADFGVQARVIEVNPGPTVTQFGLEPGFHERYDRSGELLKREKVKVSEITSLANDLALALAAPSIRIEAPVPGRTVVGIEVPNASSTVVSLRGVIETSPFQRIKAKSKLAIGLGQDVSGQPIVADLSKMPHLLIAGSTGSGKSVCINSIIACLLLHCSPKELRLLMIDPKRVELTGYNDVPHLLTPVIAEVTRAAGVLNLMLKEMDDRYKKFQTAGVRDIEKYNKQSGRNPWEVLPYIVVIIDELADLMMVAPEDIERTLCRLAQMARATGIHLVVATQRPSVDVVTGLIKANIPTRISFAVTSQVDSRTILDMVGAEKLLGRGDMLYMPTDVAKPHRLQGTYVSDEEIDDIVGFWKAQGTANYVEAFSEAAIEKANSVETADALYDQAVELARQHNRISTSLLQRRLRIGYSRAARIVDLMEAAGLVGPSEGGKSREVLISKDELGPDGEDDLPAREPYNIEDDDD